MGNQKPNVASQLRVSEYEVLDGVISLEGEVIPYTVGGSGNGAAPEFVSAAIALASIKAMYHIGAMVHVVMDKEWFLDLIFEDADEAEDLYKKFFNGLVYFYASGDDYDDDELPGGGDSATGSGRN